MQPCRQDLDDGEREKGDAGAEKRAGEDVEEPVDLEIGAAPCHGGDAGDGERPAEAAARAYGREQEDEGDERCACEGGVADTAKSGTTVAGASSTRLNC